MKSTLTCLLGLALCFVACIVAWPKLEVQPKTFSKEFKPMTVQTAHRERVSEEKKEPVMVEFGLKASFDPQPEEDKNN